MSSWLTVCLNGCVCDVYEHVWLEIPCICCVYVYVFHSPLTTCPNQCRLAAYQACGHRLYIWNAMTWRAKRHLEVLRAAVGFWKLHLQQRTVVGCVAWRHSAVASKQFRELRGSMFQVNTKRLTPGPCVDCVLMTVFMAVYPRLCLRACVYDSVSTTVFMTVYSRLCLRLNLCGCTSSLQHAHHLATALKWNHCFIAFLEFAQPGCCRLGAQTAAADVECNAAVDCAY